METHLAGGLPGFTVVGLPETAVREARDRVKGALANCGFEFPNGRVVVNLAPADLLKEGGRFDLAIAVSILRATGQLREAENGSEEWVFLAELSLAGELRGVRGSLCAALSLGADQRLLVPMANRAEARLLRERVVALSHLEDVCLWLSRPDQRSRFSSAEADTARAPPPQRRPPQVRGQSGAKRALCIAAAGAHHLLMVGPPGTGKSLLARTLPGLLPPLEAHAAMEVAAVYSAAGINLESPDTPPFRDPHHSVSMSAMVGGGSHPRPGEISLAHHGVLFLDELPHFKPSVLDSLREPLETGTVGIVRASWRSAFPARFQLVAAMNPCPAGLVCSPTSCRCRPDQVLRYQARVSGPLLDRIDLHVPVPEVPARLLMPGAELDATERSGPGDVVAARARQHDRQGSPNALLEGTTLTRVCELATAGERLLERAATTYRLSARGFHRVLRVARTVADLEGARTVSVDHLTEALSYRAMSWEGGPAAGPRATR